MVFSSPWSFSRRTILQLKYPADWDFYPCQCIMMMIMMTKTIMLMMTKKMMMLDEILSGKCPVAWDGSSFSGRKWEARFTPDCDSPGSECDKTYIHLSTRSYQSPGARHIDLYNIIKSFFNCTNIQLTGGHVQGGGFLISLWPKNGQLAFFQCPAYLWQGDNVVNCLGLFGGCKSCPDFSPGAGKQHQWLTPERLGNQVTHRLSAPERKNSSKKIPARDLLWSVLLQGLVHCWLINSVISLH